MTSPIIVNVKRPKTTPATWEIRIPHQDGERLPLVGATRPQREPESEKGLSETYYGRFYGLNSPPFHITPDPSLLFATETHQQAMGAIEYGIATGKGFIVVTGEVGVGKTTVLKMCLERLDASKSKIVYLYNPALSVPELYAAILDGLDISVSARRDSDDSLRQLQRALLTARQAGKQVILAVDEAQNMPEPTLENLRVLSNLETAKSKLLQIVLVGQPELDAVLAKRSLRQLTQRVAVRARIKPLTWRQSCRYIQYRSQCAGRLADRPLFSTPALWYLALTARGIPRTINIACDNALINGYGYSAQRISLKIAHESCRTLKLRSPLRRTALLAAAGLLLVCIAIPGNSLLRRVPVAPSAAAAAVGSSTAIRSSPVAVPDAIAAPVASTAQGSTATASPNAAAAVEPAEDEGAKSSPIATPEAARSGASVQPISEVVGADTLAPAVAEPTIKAPADDSIREPFQKWLVRRGDSVYKACWATYRQCDEQTMRAVFASNPQISSNGLIHAGEIIIMPERVPRGQSNMQVPTE